MANFNQWLPFSSQLPVRILIYFFLRPFICIKCRNKHNASVKEMPYAVVFTTTQVVNTVVMNTTAQVVFITLSPQFKDMTFVYSQSFIYHFTGLFWSNIMTSSQHVSSVGGALHRYRRGHGFKSPIGLNFFQALFLLLFKKCSLLRRSLSYSRLYPYFK